jgi:hypothetical protein
MGYGSIARRLSAADYEIVTGDATQAYNGALTLALRTLVFLRPGTILVYDKLASDIPRTWEWNIHALNPFTVVSDGRRVLIAKGAQSLCIDVLAGPPRQFAPVAAPDFSSWGRSNDPLNDVSAAPLDPAAAVQYHGKFAATSASTTAEFLVLMRVNASCHDLFAGPRTSTVTDLTALEPVDGPCDDAEPVAVKTDGAWTVRAGDRTVRLAADGRVSVGTARRGMPPESGPHGRRRDSSPEKWGKPDRAGRGKTC